MIAYPLHLIIGPFVQYPFEKLILKTTQIGGLVFSLFYLRGTAALSLKTLGLKPADGNGTAGLLKGFTAGFVILALLILSLMLLGIYTLHPGRIMTWEAVSLVIIKAVMTGLAVGLLEEILFRGALLPGLMLRTNAATAVVTISLVYAAAHFIDYPPPAAPEAITWLTAPTLFLHAYDGIVNPGFFDALAALFLLGLLLSLVRIRSGNIIQCIGLHAGLVAAVKISRYFTMYVPGNRFDYLVSNYDHRLGWLAALWLAAAILVYYFIYIRKRPEHRKATI